MWLSETYGESDTTITNLDPIKVSASRPINIAVINQKIIEQTIGIADDFSTILLQKPGVSSVPEAGSLLLVNGEGPFDNQFMIRGIPIFAPSAFAGSVFADRSAVSLALPNDIRVYSSSMSGSFSGASGAIVSIDPKILITPNKFPRAEAALSFNTLTDDFSVNFPVRRYKDRYQLSYTIPNAFPLMEDYMGAFPVSDLGYGVPASSWNFRTLGEQRFGSIKLEELGWIGNDTYGEDVLNAQLIQQGFAIAKQKNDPWGIFALTAHDTAAGIPWNISFGGAQQIYREAKIIETYVPQKKVQRSALALNSNFIIANDATSLFNIGLLMEYVYVNGSVSIKDSLAENVVYQRTGGNSNAQVHAGYKKQLQGLLLEVNSNIGCYGSLSSLFWDPGVNLCFSALGGSMVFSNELISAPPDVRGLPGPNFEKKLSHSFRSHMDMHWDILSALKIDAEPFFKWKYRVPLEHWSAFEPYWDETRMASLRVIGGNIKGDLEFLKRIGLTTKVSVSRSTVFEGENRYTYDWDEPWSTSTSLALTLVRDRVKVFAIGNYSAGLPYRELISGNDFYSWSPMLSRVPNYRSIDVKGEWLQPTDGSFVTEFDTYIFLQNICDFKNIREYQWNTFGKTPVYLQSTKLSFCLRVNFRFLYW